MQLSRKSIQVTRYVKFARYVKLSVYKHDIDRAQSAKWHNHEYIQVVSILLHESNLCWDYLAFIWTQSVEVVMWQVGLQHAETIRWGLWVYG